MLDVLDIPDDYFILFKACNASSDWGFRKEFYSLKNKILLKFGTPAGYDMQIIKKKCFYCSGTWINPSNNNSCGCQDGIYSITHIALARYLLNGSIFHRPVAKVTADGSIIHPITYLYCKESLKISEKLNFNNKIEGLIQHFSPAKFDPEFAFCILLWKYDPDSFINHRIFTSKEEKNTKKLYKIILKSGSVRSGLAEYFKVDPDKYIELLPPLGYDIAI